MSNRQERTLNNYRNAATEIPKLTQRRKKKDDFKKFSTCIRFIEAPPPLEKNFLKITLKNNIFKIKTQKQFFFGT